MRKDGLGMNKRTEKCPGCGAAVLLQKGERDLQPRMYDVNGALHACESDKQSAVYEPRPIGQKVVGATVIGFEVRKRKLTLSLSNNSSLEVYCGGIPLKIWLLTNEGVTEDVYGKGT